VAFRIPIRVGEKLSSALSERTSPSQLKCAMNLRRQQKRALQAKPASTPLEISRNNSTCATPRMLPTLALNNEIFRGYYFQTRKVSGHTALIAYPAKYRSSGVMTFIVSKDGVVYEKDLGANTSTIASSLKAGKLHSSWRAAE
jgi:hypothetical protein